MKLALILFCTLAGLYSYAQPVSSAIALQSTGSNLPLVFYISGDGGWNSFSTSFIHGLNQKGYPVIGLNSREFFWSRKTPQEAAQAVNRLMEQYQDKLKAPGVIFIGYSFGADVLPFIEPLLNKTVSQRVKRTILLSPSSSTDFEVHLLDVLSLSTQHDVPGAINQLTHPVTLVFGAKEKDFPLDRLHKNNIQLITLNGGHHYDGEVNNVIENLLSQLR